MKKLEQTVGEEKMQKVMQSYFNEWKMKHPYPTDFKLIAETVSGQNLDELFNLLHEKGSIDPAPSKPTKTSFLFPKVDGQHKYVSTQLPLTILYLHMPRDKLLYV